MESKRNWRETRQSDDFPTVASLDDAHDGFEVSRLQLRLDIVLEPVATDEKGERRAARHRPGNDQEAERESVQIAGGDVEDDIAECHWKGDDCEEKKKDETPLPNGETFEPDKNDAKVAFEYE